MSKETKKLTLIGLILMIFTSVFGFANAPVAFYRMGYAAIPWYIFAALAFFIPYALMMAEYGAAFKHEKGGIYSWMEQSVGPLYAFIGTFMWFTSYIIWMVGISSKVWIPFTTLIFGADKTQDFAFFGLNATQSLGILAMLWMVLVTFFASKGMNQIAKITSIGGIAVTALNVVLLVASVVIWGLNHGEMAEPIHGVQSFIQSPNAEFGNAFSILGFVIFAIFAYGGLEAVGGLVDETENAEKNFPKGIIVSALIISVGYALSLLLWGVSTNWESVLSGDKVNLGNITYVLMDNLGLELGKALGMSAGGAASLGMWFARITGLSMFLAYTGAFFTLIYSPLKTIIQGTPKGIWPEKLTKLNENGMPQVAMWVQAGMVVVIIALVSFGGKGAQEFYNVLTLMTNVAMTLPYLFLAAAFPAFKKKDNLDHSFEIFKTEKSTKLVTGVVVFVVGFANVFTIIEPMLRAQNANVSETIWMLGGPIIFSLIAYTLYKRYEKRSSQAETK
ncbi:glutamate/gamma-aminobutyrate family transporter YjeM [Vagococcus humatus]|uniref:Glutamate/gamma-aminobutyrate family transporter YjeM n=1 Tax=Vagococcus humatus TaxID=1889241 RepID=A0A3S0AWR2_9ENTE|nr:glutamate/gamma-aminobutyrate family transporter YjeM [Vagococcus humatus]RST88947.1 glutamate/gamma-aminobutyrate family transporter YjeM [Vagococcus humatus]